MTEEELEFWLMKQEEDYEQDQTGCHIYGILEGGRA